MAYDLFNRDGSIMAILRTVSTDTLLDEILRRNEKDICGADVLLDLLVEREILDYADEDDYGLYRKL